MTAPALALPAGITDVVMAAAALAEAGPVDPALAPCGVCGEPPLVHDDGGHPYEAAAEWALALAAQGAQDAPVMADIVAGLDAEHVPSGRVGPSPSDAGACPRQLWYRDRPPADYLPRPIDAGRAAIGTLIHRAAASARAARYPWRLYELRIPIPGLDRDGRVDEYDPVLGRVIDLKSAGERKWDVIGESGPTGDQWAQVRIYGYALDFAGYPVRELEIITINRDTGAEESFREDFDPAAGLAALDELTANFTMVESGVIPPRGGYGPKDWRCQWCPAMDHCWSVELAARLGRSPESVTILGVAPDDPSILWAGREFIALRATRLAAEKVEDRAKALLQGIPPRLYGADRDGGGIEITESWSTSYGYKSAYEQMCAAVDLLTDLVPIPDDVAALLSTSRHVPIGRSKTTTAKPVRAAKRAAARTRKKPAKTAAETAADQVAAAVRDGGAEK